MGTLTISKDGLPVDVAYQQLQELSLIHIYMCIRDRYNSYYQGYFNAYNQAYMPKQYATHFKL